MLKEYKVIKTTHLYSNVCDPENKDNVNSKVAYAIIATTYLIAEPGSKEGVYMNETFNGDDMFIITSSFERAVDMLNEFVTEKIGRKRKSSHI